MVSDESTAGSRAPGSAADAPRLIAYAIPSPLPVSLAPARVARPWMQATRRGFANRCLPLLMANQSGWTIGNPVAVRATWDGSSSAGGISLEIDGPPEASNMVHSDFGYGVLTWSIPYLFRTPPGFNLLVRGPTNAPKDGIVALDGLVETDWAVATFTMNWKFTRPAHTVSFAAGEPICMIMPQRRGELESFEPVIVPLAEDPETERQLRDFALSRKRTVGFIMAARQLGGGADRDGVFEKHYFEGTSSGGAGGPEHQTKLSLRPFRRADPTISAEKPNRMPDSAPAWADQKP